MKFDNAKIRSPSSKLNKIVPLENGKAAINIFTGSKKGEIYYLDVNDLIPFKAQARYYFNNESIDSLASTIKEHGIRQPLTVTKSLIKNDKFEIVSGERRFLAAKKIGLQKVPCIVIDNHSFTEEIALIENVQREDLHPVELGQGYKSLYSSGNFKTHEDIAKKLGISRTQITKYIKYAEFSAKIKRLILINNIKERATLRKLLNLLDDLEREKYIEENVIRKRNSDSNYSDDFSILSISIRDGKIVSKIKNLDKYDNKKIKEELQNLINNLDLKNIS